PVVSTLHFARPRGHDALTRRLYSVIPRLVTAEVAISRFVADHVGGQPWIILNGVPAPTGPVSPVRERDPVVLVAQRFESEKDTGTAMRAFAASGLAQRGWQLHVAGEGSQRAMLEALALDLGIIAATVFLGRVDDVSDRMGRAGM